MPRRFSKGEALRFGWEVTKRHFWLLFLMIVIVGGLSRVSRIVEWIRPATAEEKGLAIVIVCVQVILNLFLSLGLIRVCMRLTDNEGATLSDLFGATGRQVFSLFVASVIDVILMTIGLVLLIVPGIIVALRLSMAQFLIVDKALGPIEALRQSWAMTEGSAWNLFLFGILVVLLNIAGLLALIVGLFFTVPTSIVANTFIYRKLSATQAPTPSPIPV